MLLSLLRATCRHSPPRPLTNFRQCLPWGEGFGIDTDFDQCRVTCLSTDVSPFILLYSGMNALLHSWIAGK